MRPTSHAIRSWKTLWYAKGSERRMNGLCSMTNQLFPSSVRVHSKAFLESLLTSGTRKQDLVSELQDFLEEGTKPFVDWYVRVGCCHLVAAFWIVGSGAKLSRSTAQKWIQSDPNLAEGSWVAYLLICLTGVGCCLVHLVMFVPIPPLVKLNKTLPSEKYSF